MTPLAVSVVIPCFNHGRFLAQAIDSALAERPFEVVVVDDGSTDDTAEVLERYGSAITALRQPNAGLSAARNAGIAACAGDLVQLLDADDELAEGVVARVATSAATTDAAAFFGGWQEMSETGDPIVEVPSAAFSTDAFHALIHPMAVGPPGRFALRRWAVLAAGGFDRSLGACEDWDLWLRLAAAGHVFQRVPGIALRYRNSAGSMSKDYRRMWRAGTTVLGRAATVHRNCSQCATALAEARREWRRWCYLSMLAPELKARWRAGGALEATGRAVAATIEDPGLVPFLIRSASHGPRRQRAERRSSIAAAAGRGPSS